MNARAARRGRNCCACGSARGWLLYWGGNAVGERTAQWKMLNAVVHNVQATSCCVKHEKSA